MEHAFCILLVFFILNFTVLGITDVVVGCVREFSEFRSFKRADEEAIQNCPDHDSTPTSHAGKISY
jgi:hypothetical protein